MKRTLSTAGAQAEQPTEWVTRSAWTWLFLAVVALAACAAATGWFVDGFYADDGNTLAAKGRYGDLVILVVMVPLGLRAYMLERRHCPCARPIMLGLVAHLGFMYGVLAFNYRENALFVVYSTVLGLCVLLAVTGLTDFARSIDQPEQTLATRLASIALLLAVLVGYGFWVSDVVNALLDDTAAESLSGTDLPANAARVIDMAIMLPLTAVGAARLWTRRGDGLAIAATMSTYLILIGLTVVVMEVGLANTTDQDLDIGKIAGFGFTISLSVIAGIVTYRALSHQTDLD